MKLKDVFEKTVQFFKEKKIESARLDAELLISAALKTERLNIYLRYEQPLSEAEVQTCRDFVKRRSLGEPVAYILGEKGFYAQMFSVGPGVLIPRPETELLVEEALQFINENKIDAPQILDLGAGSGCIGFSILKNIASGQLTSVEKSPAAFEYLKANQNRLSLGDRVELVLSDVMSLNFEEKKFDVIVANPPYIDPEDTLVEVNVKKFEPNEALFSAAQGVSDFKNWTNRCAAMLKPRGLMLFEIGHTQGVAARAHLEGLERFTQISVLRDLSGLDRVVKALNNK